MKSKFSFLVFTLALFFVSFSYAQEIQMEILSMKLPAKTQVYSKIILENEIPGINVHQISQTGKLEREEIMNDGYKYVYLFIKGNGNVKAAGENYEIVPETILLPNAIQKISIKSAINDTLHFLKIESKLTEQDLLDLKEFPLENTQKVYYTKFIDTEPYTEPIKSPNTVSRTVLPNKYIPRMAMGTVAANGPDKVAPHEHGMLEQLFLGLTDNNITVYADNAKKELPTYALLHIPLGSMHSAEAFKGDKMYYMWMDFFRDKAGEEWLKTHKAIKSE